MMGFDIYGYGACSSNLSALAPPFSVDRTVFNLDTNPCVNNNFIKPPPPFNELPPQPYIAPPPPPPPPPFNELPPQPYIAPPLLPPPSYSGAGIYDSSLPSWGLHSNPTSISVANYNTSFNSEADSVSTRDNYLAPVQPLNMTADDESGAFSYVPYTDRVKTAVDTVKPYHQSYVSPAFEKKESLAGLGDSTYDFLSTCCLAPSGGTSQGDYTKKVSGWSCLNRWDGSWNGFKDLESDNYTDSKWDSSFYSNEKNAAGPPLCMDYVKPGPGATKYDEVKQSSNALFMRPPTIGTTYSQLNMELAHQNEEFSSKSVVVDYPHLTLNSNKYEVGDNPSRYNLYPENICRDDANTSLTGPHSSNKSLSKASESHLPQMGSPKRYSLNLGEIKVNDSVGNSSKSLDPYNPAEDSPCWKGASSSRFSCFGGSRASALQPLPEKSPYVRDVSQELGESFTSNPSKPMENSLSPTMMRTSFSTYSNRGGDGNFTSTKPEAFCPEQNCNWVFAPPIKLPLEDGSLTSEKCATRSCLVEKEKNANESSGSLHVPNHNAHDDISNLTNLNEEESTPKIDFTAMIKTMHNLSDLLLFYCSNDECALKEQENVALKHVISNLNSCMSKVPSSTLKRKSVLSADLHQDANATNIAAANAIDNVDDNLAQDKKSRNMLPCTEDEECHEFCNVRNVSDIGKPDEMTQAIKKVLSEKFNGEEERLPQALLYKNLWLEAEAVICSSNFKARFDRVKNEVEKSNPLKVKDGLQDMIDMEKSSHSEVYPDVKLVNHLNSDMTSSIKNSPMISISSPTDDVMARFRILKSRDDKSTSMSPTDNVKDVRSCASDAKSSIPDSPIRSTTNHEDDIIARFRILTSRGDTSASMSSPRTIIHPISSMFPSLKDVNTLPTDTCIQGSPLSNNSRGSNDTGSNDTDDAVMARLRILKCRADKKNEFIDTGISYHLQNSIDEDKLNVNKTDIEMSFQSCNEEEVESQHSAGWYDGPSIDWELVLKDDFVWQK